jgi:hypothetical protein
MMSARQVFTKVNRSLAEGRAALRDRMARLEGG